MQRSTSRLKWLLVPATVVLLPLAAADAGCVDHPGIPLDYYLLKDAAGELRLSALAPSARNETQWVTNLSSDGTTTSETRVRLEFPSPEYVIDEEQGIAGRLKAMARRTDGTLPQGFLTPGPYPQVEVLLIEGARQTSLGSAYPSNCSYYGPMWDDCYGQGGEFKGSFPGHGDQAAPHTHGDGGDPNRPLLLSDVQVEIVMRLVADEWYATPLGASEWEFAVTIDGTSFVHLTAVEATPEVVVVEETAAQEAAPLGMASDASGSEAPADDGSAFDAIDPNIVAPASAGHAGIGTSALLGIGAGLAAIMAAALVLVVRHRKP